MYAEWIPTLRAVFFDIDNTLVDRDAAFIQALPQWLQQYAPALHHDEYAAHVETILLADNQGHTNRILFCGWLLDTYGVTTTTKEALAAELAEMVALYIAPQPAMFTMLEYIQTQFSLGIISNGGGKTQRTKLERAGLSHCFTPDAIYIEGETGLAKPDRFVFERVIREHNLAAHQVLFVGDDPVNDVEGAARAGMRTCWVRNNQSPAKLTTPPDFTINTIQELFYHFHPNMA